MTITTKQHIGFSQKLITVALLAAFGQAHAEEVIYLARLIDPVGVGSSSGGNASAGSSGAASTSAASTGTASATVASAPAASNAGSATANALQPTKPQSEIRAGAGGVTGDSRDRALFGEYNGLREKRGYLLLDADINRHDEVTGTWTALLGRNLGLDDRDLRFSQRQYGNWKYSAEFSELTRNYPRTVSTGVQGIGTTNLTVNSALPKTDVDLQTKRKSVTLAADKWLTSSVQFEASFKSENKDGARLFSRGVNCGLAGPFTTVTCPPTPANGVGALLLLPEPINSNIKQLDAKLNLAGEKYLLSGAYYGSLYTNANGAINQTITGLVAPNGTVIDLFTPGTSGAQVRAYMQAPTALPPDNQAQQLSLGGNYAFTPSTRATFKYARTHATQHENFDSMGLTTHPAGVNDLHGILDTTLGQVGFTTRPWSKLSLLADFRYEDRNDRTPLKPYSPVAGNTNGIEPLTKRTGKLEASYQLPYNYRATVGGDYETVNRGVPETTYKPGGLNALREETREVGWRAELRGSISERFNAAVSYLNSQRDGSNWLNATIQGTPVLSDTAAVSLGGASSATVKDRHRDKVKVSADWMPTDRLSLQFMAENGKDKYTEPHLPTLDDSGLKDTRVRLNSLDAALALSDTWKLTGYASWGKQGNHVNMVNGAAPAYKAELENTNTAAGIGARGKVTSEFEVGGDVSYRYDRNHYGQLQTTTTVLPDVIFRQGILQLFGKLALEKNSDVRVDVVRRRTFLGEWTWENNGRSFFYSDNTTVSMKQMQNVTFVGATYSYKFW